MYRRRGPNSANETGDEVQLFEGEDEGVSEVDTRSPQSRIGEENHVIPHRFVMFRKRIITKVASPKGKLLYWWVTVAFLGISSFLLVLVPLLVDKNLTKQDCSDFEGDSSDLPYLYDGETGNFEICQQREVVLNGRLGIGRSYVSENKLNFFEHSMDSFLNITALQRKSKNCLLVQWVGLSSINSPIQDCYDIGEAYWYGAYENEMQDWPINASRMDENEMQDWPINASRVVSYPFLPHDYLSSPGEYFGPILHPLWVNTKGVGIIVDEGVQLHVSMNSTNLCLIAQPFELDCTSSDTSDRTFLNYTVCVFDTVSQVSQYFLNDSGLIPHPNSTPSVHVFDKPIWSTWAEFKTNLTTENVASFCDQIFHHQFNSSQLEIDDGYSQYHGELDFNANINLTELLNTSCSNMNITVWVHPFVNYNASNFENGLKADMYLPSFSHNRGNSVSLVKWWQGFGAVINFVNTSIADFHGESLSDFRERFGISSFKFDAGEYTYLPRCVHVDGLNHPGEFTKAYSEFVGDLPYSDRAEVRVGYFTQNQPILVRLLDRSSTWGLDNGLQSVLNAVLSIGLGGYIFVIPDMIGGNGVAINDLDSTTKPPLELYVRWLQLTTFLPVMQFSITPWTYNDSDIIIHVRNLTQLHFSLEFGRLAQNSLSTGFPIIRPLWWNALAVDRATWTISDQFFVGDEYMVAPVLNPNQVQREVYFPRGSNYTLGESLTHESVCPNKICHGGSSHTFNVSLYEILYFRVSHQ